MIQQKSEGAVKIIEIEKGDQKYFDDQALLDIIQSLVLQEAPAVALHLLDFTHIYSEEIRALVNSYHAVKKAGGKLSIIISGDSEDTSKITKVLHSVELHRIIPIYHNYKLFKEDVERMSGIPAEPSEPMRSEDKQKIQKKSGEIKFSSSKPTAEQAEKSEEEAGVEAKAETEENKTTGSEPADFEAPLEDEESVKKKERIEDILETEESRGEIEQESSEEQESVAGGRNTILSEDDEAAYLDKVAGENRRGKILKLMIKILMLILLGAAGYFWFYIKG